LPSTSATASRVASAASSAVRAPARSRFVRLSPSLKASPSPVDQQGGLRSPPEAGPSRGINRGESTSRRSPASAVGRSSSVAVSTSGVRKVMYRDMVDWSTPKISAHTSSMMFCRRYPHVTTIASRKDRSRGRPFPLFHGRSSDRATRYSISSSCSSFSPDIRSNRNGFSIGRGLARYLLCIDWGSRCFAFSAACRRLPRNLWEGADLPQFSGGFA
jgi:hypothetical protein